jgi:hypothetical protein
VAEIKPDDIVELAQAVLVRAIKDLQERRQGSIEYRSAQRFLYSDKKEFKEIREYWKQVASLDDEK